MYPTPEQARFVAADFENRGLFQQMFFRKKESPGAADWLIAGLGNPGAKYERTRHNVGFLALDMLASKLGTRVDRLKFKSLYGKAESAGSSILLLKPQTFMNLSGDAIDEAAAYFRIPSERIVVIYDDVALPAGRLRIRARGSDGGHNGIKSIILRMNTDVFPRVKIGVSPPPHPDYAMADWVLSTFSASEIKRVAPMIERAVDAALDIVAHGVDYAANRHNSANAEEDSPADK